MMGALLEGPYWIVDILPEQVGADAAGQYFAEERYFLQRSRIVPLRRKYAEIGLTAMLTWRCPSTHARPGR